MNLEVQKIHEKAIQVAERFHRSESELIDILQALDEKKVFLHFGFSSLFEYAIRALKLSEASASTFITISRKARAVPELKQAISERKITVSSARRIVPVLKVDNKNHWLELAATLPKAQLEREIARVAPEAVKPDRLKFVGAERLELRMGLDEETSKMFKRAQDLVSQSKGNAATYEQTLKEILALFLARRDPVEKAKRLTPLLAKHGPGHVIKESASKTQAEISRKPLSASIKHAVHLRDNGQCTYVSGTGERCSQRRWLQIHHDKPVSLGGNDSAENLKTLCFGHHRGAHLTY